MKLVPSNRFILWFKRFSIQTPSRVQDLQAFHVDIANGAAKSCAHWKVQPSTVWKSWIKHDSHRNLAKKICLLSSQIIFSLEQSISFVQAMQTSEMVLTSGDVGDS